MKYITFIPMIFLAQITLSAQNPTYPPQDETYLDAGLSAFVKNLLEAIDHRDKHFLNDALDFYVVSSLDSRGGLDEFKRTWSPEQDSSQMWPLMKRVIQLGGVFLNDTADQTGRYQFVFPYVYNMPLDVEDDYFNIGVITGKNVNLRSGPDTASPIKSKLTYDVVWYVLEDLAGKTQSGTNRYGDPEWYMVETYDRSQRGWVNWQYVYSPTDARLFLYKNNIGDWKISAFVAGD
jgi:hypothetical protein